MLNFISVFFCKVIKLFVINPKSYQCQAKRKANKPCYIQMAKTHGVLAILSTIGLKQCENTCYLTYVASKEQPVYPCSLMRAFTVGIWILWTLGLPQREPLTHCCRETLKGVHRQTVQTQFRRRIMWHLISIPTVC